MTSILAQPAAQLGGIARVLFVEHRHVATWPVPIGGQLLANHQLATGHVLAQLESTAYAGGLTTETADTPQGVSFAHVLEGFYAGESPAVLSQFAFMQGKRYLVLVQYFNGTTVAVGNRLSGLLFTSKYTSGKKPGERRGYTWRFEGITSTAAAYLTQPLAEPGAGSTVAVRISGRPVYQLTAGQRLTITTRFKINYRVMGAASGTGTVDFYKRGQLLARLTVGQQLEITSPFKITHHVTE